MTTARADAPTDGTLSAAPTTAANGVAEVPDDAATAADRTIDAPVMERESARALMHAVRSYLPEPQALSVRSAMQFAAQCHAGQKRESGEDFVEHPIAVTAELAKLSLPADIISAGLLHDTVEDCDVETDEIRQRFGETVARLVDGVTKLTHIDLQLNNNGAPTQRSKRRHADQRERRRIESLRKMFATAGDDARVLLIKLADRMHNMETLGHLQPDRRTKIARETIEIYAPLADRLGMNDIKWRMEDAAFHHLNPAQYTAISRLVNRTRRDREQYAKLAVQKLTDAVVNQAGIPAAISGRAKHLYSIFRKKQRYESAGRSFDDIYDLIALRVITDNDRDCYPALSVVHGLWESIPNAFDDYISRPKNNGYKSIHTTVRGPGNQPLEVQIRSKEMHQLAEEGVAAHWAYKDGEPNPNIADSFARTMSWLKELVEIEGAADDSAEFIDAVEGEILQVEQIQVYTPAGDVIELPHGATPLDFAYRIHTELGHQTVGAIVNGKLVRLDSQLRPGDTVEIRKSKAPKGPSLDWRDPNQGYLMTESARAKVRHWFGRQERETAVQHGKHQLKRVVDQLRRMGQVLTQAQIAELLQYESVDELVLELGRSHEQVSTVVRGVADATGKATEQESPATSSETRDAPPPPESQLKTKDGSHGVVVMGIPGVKVNLPKCCSPVYGEEIMGFLTRGKGVTAHLTTCKNLKNIDEPDRLVDLEWGHRDEFLPVRVSINGSDRIGLINDISGILREERINVHAMRTDEGDEPGKSKMIFTIYVRDVAALARLFGKFERVRGVDHVSRVS